MQYSGYISRPPSWNYSWYIAILGVAFFGFASGVPSDPCAVRDHMGTEFVVGFLEAMMPDVSPHIYIVGSRRSTSVSIYTKQGNYTLNITPYNPVQSLDLMNPAIAGSEAIVVKAEHDVSVYGIDRGNSMDSFLALPTDALGTEYYVVTYDIAARIQRDRRGSQFMVISTDHDTRVRIQFKPNNHALCNGQVLYSDTEVTLDRLETLHCIDRDYDLTGTHIVANKPIAVLSGNKCANVPKNNRYCDHLVEQLPPVSSWEKEFITSPLKGRSHGDRFRVIAARNLTVVRTTTADSYFILNEGEFKELDVGSNSSAAIVANSPILVMQYSKGGNVDGTGADPFMMLVPGIAQFVTEALIPSISVVVGPELTNNINIVIDCTAKSNLFHGIFHFPEDNFHAASYATEEMLKRKFCIKQHSLVKNPGLYFLEDRYSGFNSFSVLVYGYSSGTGNEAYGMPAGMVLRNNSCVRRTHARLTSTVPPGVTCSTVGPPMQQISRSDHSFGGGSDLLDDHTVSGFQTDPTTGHNLKSPTRGGNYLTVAIIIGMFSSVIIIILAIYVCFLKRKIRQLEAERKTFGQLQLSSMLVGPDGYIDLDGSQMSQREYMTLNNTDGVWRVGKVRRVDRAMFRSLSATNGKSTSAANRCNGQSANGEGSFRDRRLTASESAPQDITGATGIRRQPSTSDSCGGMSQANGSTAALISISRQGSISEEPNVDSFPMLRPLGATRAGAKHTSIHIDSDMHPDLVPSRRQRKHLWRSVSNPGVNPFSGAHGDLKVYYEVPKNNRPLTTGNVTSSNSTSSQNYDRPPRRQRTNSEEISPAASIFLTHFPNSLSSRQDDGYMSMKDPRTSVSSQASGSQAGDISHASGSTANSMMDKAYSSIPDENFNNANDTGDTDSTDYTELN